MTPHRSFAVLSCDLDTVDRHLDGYGFAGLPPCDLIYRTAVRRLLELLDELGMPGVFFVIGRDARAQRRLLHEIAAAGHEVASHSMTHPQPFRTLGDDALREEIATSREVLSEASETEVIGFRAPAWDIDGRVLEMVDAAGYRYDASMFPTPALIASRLATYRRSASKASIFAMDLLGHAFASRTPHRLQSGTGRLAEFPIAVTRWIRFPVYHTLSYLVPPWFFGRALASLLRSREPICYEFHAADLLDLDSDHVDERMARHPGMRVPLAEKRAALRDILRRIASEREVVTYRQALSTSHAEPAPVLGSGEAEPGSGTSHLAEGAGL